MKDEKTIDKTKLLFSFEDLSTKDKVLKKAIKEFAKHKETVSDVEVDPKIKTSSGYKFREMTLIFADSQKVTMRLNPSGNVYQVLINGTLTPIANQDDHLKAIIEIADKLDKGRDSFQKKLAKAKVEVPKAIKTSATNMIAVLTEKKKNLTEAIAAADAEIATVQAQLAM